MSFGIILWGMFYRIFRIPNSKFSDIWVVNYGYNNYFLGQTFVIHQLFMPANLRLFCHQNNSSTKFHIVIRWFTILNFIDELFRWQKKRKLSGVPMFELNYCPVFHRTWAISIQSRLDFIQLISDCLTSKKTVTPSVCVFSIVQFLGVKAWPNG